MGIYQPGEIVAGRYRISRALSQGGMGAVYLGEQLSLGRQVAIKVILAHHEDSDALRARFDHEARAVCRLHHPNIITYHDYGHDEAGRPFLVMEYLAGYPGTDLVYGNSVPTVPACVHVLGQLCSALLEAHERGIIHRDLKWSNAMIVPQAHDPLFTKLIDFGILKLAVDGSSGDQRQELTRTGVLLGTPQYMSPEAICGRPIDGRADQYSLGVMAYELLTGRRPFASAERLELLRQHVHDDPPPMDDIGPARARHPELEAVVLRALAKHPGERFPSIVAFHAALARAVGAPEPAVPVQARRGTRPGGAVAPRTPFEQSEAGVTPISGRTAPRGVPVVSPTPTGLERAVGAPLSPSRPPSSVEAPRTRPRRALPARVRHGLWVAGALALVAAGYAITVAVFGWGPGPGPIDAAAQHSTSSSNGGPLRDKSAVIAGAAHSISTPVRPPPLAGESGSDAPPPAPPLAATAGEAPADPAAPAVAATRAADAPHADRTEVASATTPSAGGGAPIAADGASTASGPAVRVGSPPEPAAATNSEAGPTAAATPATATPVARHAAAARARQGTLTVVATPYAEVSVDGAPFGTTPIRARSVRAGRLTVELRHPTFGVETRLVTVKPDGAATLTVDMRH